MKENELIDDYVKYYLQLYRKCDHFVVESGYDVDCRCFHHGCIKCGLDTKSLNWYDGKYHDRYGEPMLTYFKSGGKIKGYSSNLFFCNPKHYYTFENSSLIFSFEIGKELYKNISAENPNISNPELEELLKVELNKMEEEKYGHSRKREGR